MNLSDLTHGAYLYGLAGGLLIGAAAALLMLGNGRIAGISGIVGDLLRSGKNDKIWRVMFLLGLAASPLIYRTAAELPPITAQTGTPGLIVAGLLVGIGTRYASGCTSGHGVCGIANGSIRSIAATLAFMATAFATVFVMRHLLAI